MTEILWWIIFLYSILLVLIFAGLMSSYLPTPSSNVSFTGYSSTILYYTVIIQLYCFLANPRKIFTLTVCSDESA